MKIDRLGTERLFKEIQAFLESCGLRELQLEYEAILRSDPILEIEVDFHAPEEQYFDVIEFWMEEGQQHEEVFNWFVGEVRHMIKIRKDDMETWPKPTCVTYWAKTSEDPERALKRVFGEVQQAGQVNGKVPSRIVIKKPNAEGGVTDHIFRTADWTRSREQDSETIGDLKSTDR